MNFAGDLKKSANSFEEISAGTGKRLPMRSRSDGASNLFGGARRFFFATA